MSLPGAVSAAPSPHNDWTLIAPVEPGHPAPTAQVSVLVVGDGGDPAGAARTVAALRQQRYPDRLLQIVTVTADSDFADQVGTAKGEIIVRIPAGAVPAPDLVSALTRWQQASPAAVSVAVPMIFSGRAPDPDVIVAHASAGTLGQLFPGSTVDPGLARLLDTTHQLRTADHLVFLAAAGTGYAFQRDRYQAGSDRFQGTDVEVAYRLAQAGAVFVPEPAATLWTAAPADPVTTGQRADAELTDLVPFPRERRNRPGRVWQVPLVTAVVPVDQPYRVVRSCVDRLLGGDERDLHVALVGDWAVAGTDSGGADSSQADSSGTDGSRADLRLLAAEYRSEPRVRMVSSAPVTAFPAPYLLRVPARLGVGPRTVRSLVAAMEKWRCGLLRVLPAGAGAPTHAVELWSTAARSRALHAGTADGALVEAVAASHGQRWETGSEYDVVDLTAAGSGAAGGSATAGPRGGRRAGQTVTVGGARSLGRATVFVARKYARGVRRRLVSR